MRRIGPALAFALVAVGCHFDVNGVDTDGGGGGGGGGGVVDMASGDLAVGGGGGDLAMCPQCPAGCTGSPLRCLMLQPSGPVTAADYGLAGLTAVNATGGGDVTINTDDGSIMGGGVNRPANMSGVVGGIGYRVQTQTNGPSVGVFSVASLTLPAGKKLIVRGNNAFALASAGDVMIAGTVDGSCAMMPGPGGYAGGTSAMDGSGPAGGFGKAGGAVAGAAGGGGAGYGDNGGSGGLLTGQAPNNGTSWGDLTATTFVLVGGAGGGGGGNNGGKGGGGGGAIQIVANGTISVAANGIVNVGGCGGAQGGPGKAGGGGGAGGAIVFEAIHVTLAAGSVLAANGGGGGGGDAGSLPGANANASVTPATGGAAGAGNNDSGGNGGASNGMPGQHFTNGRPGNIADPVAGNGGGGGGGVGRIAIRALNPSTGGIIDMSSAVTPDPGDTNANAAHPTVYGSANFQ